MRKSRFEIVRTAGGHHARFISANGQTVWVTESYTRRRPAQRAINALARALDAPVEIRDVDLRGAK